MNIALSDTILYVTGKQGIENTTEQELQTMVASYPYFTPAQLVYAAKLKSQNSFKLQTQIQKAGLFFNNFKWLQYQLMEVNVGNFASGVVENNAPIVEEKVEEQKVEAPVVVAVGVEENKVEIKEQVLLVEEPKVIEELPEIPLNTVFEQYDVLETIPANANDFMSNMSIPTIEEVKGIMNGIDERKEDTAEEIIAVSMEEITANQSATILPQKEIGVEEISIDNNANHHNEVEVNSEPIVTGFEVNEPVVQEEIVAAPTNDIHAEIAALKANWYVHNPVENVEEIVVEQNQVENKVIDPVENKLATDLASIKTEFNKPIDALANEPLPFETDPYYTIDYFASQGIKFDYTKDPQDKLTAKMLKFTDWLKKMKSPKPEINITVDDPELDKAIQNIAAASNQSKEIITETMAEIFAKQGKTEKAIQLYIKLSFLIPDKSAYFATKLKELKGI